MATKATLMAPDGRKVIVDSGSPEAKRLFNEGYQIFRGQPAARPQFGLDDPDAISREIQSQTGGLQDIVGSQASFANALRQALMGADQKTSQLRDQSRGLETEYLTAPTKLREQFMSRGIDDPFVRQRLIDERLGTLLDTRGQIGEEIDKRGGNLEQVLQSGLGGLQSLIQSRQLGLEGLQNLFGVAEGRAAERRALSSRSGGGGGGRSSNPKTYGDVVGGAEGRASDQGWTKVPNSSGGFDFYNNGQPITVEEYARLSGISIRDALTDSLSRQDIDRLQEGRKKNSDELF